VKNETLGLTHTRDA